MFKGVNFLISTVFILVALVLSGCGKGKGNSDESAIDGLQIVVPATINMNETLTARVTKPDAVKYYHWVVRDETEAEEDACEDYTSAELVCIFEFPGSKVISLQATTTDSETVDLVASIDVLDPAAPSDQAPIITLNLSANGVDIATVSTFLADEDGAVNFAEGESITFDFSNTTDGSGDPVSSLTFFLQIGNGAYQEIPLVYTHTFDTIDVVPISVKAVDSAGNETVKAFNAFVRCAEGAFDPVAIDGAKVLITAGTANNYFNFNAAGAASGGKQPFRYMWDFNGDGIFDSDWIDDSAMNEQYTIYGGMRDATLKVWDVGCNYFGKLRLGDIGRHDFVIPMTDGVPGTPQKDQMPGYHFIQAQIEGLSGNESASANSQVTATYKIGRPITKEDPQRVRCDYKKKGYVDPNGNIVGLDTATFNIKGLNYYWKEDGTVQGVQHGIHLKVDNLADPTGVIAGAPDNFTASGTPSSVNYYTDGASDSIARDTYRRVDCSYHLSVKTYPPGPGTCADTPDFGYPVEIDGTFSCPAMRADDGKTIAATQGAFFCEVAKVDACPPGGGGGGGGLPPIPR